MHSFIKFNNCLITATPLAAVFFITYTFHKYICLFDFSAAKVRIIPDICKFLKCFKAFTGLVNNVTVSV